VSGQVVLSFLLLIGAGLFIRTLANLKSLDIGFRADNVLLVSLNPALNRYSPERVGAFYDQLLERAGSLADVRTASLADQPLLGGAYIDGIAVEGRPSVNSNNSGVAIKLVSPRFFETMEIAIRLGRDFVPEDRRDSPKVAIVNQAFVGEFLAGTNPLGKRIGIGLPADMEIVGVISDTKYRDLRGPVPSTVYVPLSQSKMPQPQRWLHLRTSGDLQIVSTTIREQVRELDKDLPITKISSTSALIDQQLVTQRLIAGLSGVFAGLALLLASIGLYGVLAYNVERRTREIGIRMSLGAARGAVMWSMMRHCLRTAAAGIMIGLPLSFWLTRFVRAQLYGVEPGDAATVVVATLSLLVVAAIAGFLPARRASRVDPTVALRHD
jgi:predicted permease